MNNSRLQAPLVLVHGIFGFDQLTLGRVRVADYFRLIPDALREAGQVVPRPPQLNPAGSIAQRASDLKRYLEDENNADVFGKPVHLVAHSMGGLDCRYMISKLGMAGRVLSLTTIGTPHHGSPVADLVLAAADPILSQKSPSQTEDRPSGGHFAQDLIRKVQKAFVERLGVNLRGIRDLTIDACTRFNTDVPDCPTVRYFSLAGQFEPPRILDKPISVLGLFHDFIRDREGNNDGLVSVKSATFGQCRESWKYLGTWEGNHFRLINWGANMMPSPLELADAAIVEKYKELAARIDQLATN
jgi:triacylglycerol lipase